MLLPLTSAFLLGLALGAYLPYLPLTILAVCLLIAVTLALVERHDRITPLQGTSLYATLLAGLLWWTASSAAVGPGVLSEHAPARLTVVGTVVQPVRHTPARSALMVHVHSIQDGQTRRPADGLLRLTWRTPDRLFMQGDTIRFTARVRAPSGTSNPGGFDYGDYLRRRGVAAVASVTGPNAITLVESGRGRPRWALWHRIDTWRETIRTAALSTLDQPAAGIYLGLIVGEQGFLAPAVRDAFMASGTVHILSISGSHLGLIAFLSFVLVRAACRLAPPVWLLHLTRRITPTRLAAILTIPPVVFYALLAGAELATIRSLVMIVVFLLAVWRGAPRHLLHALALAALAILLHDPAALFDISFQLSFASVLAIALILLWRGTLDEGPDESDRPLSVQASRWLREYVWLTGGVTAATLPLVAYHFNQVPWLGLLANVLVVPLAGFLVVPLGLASAVWLLASGGQALPMGGLNETVLMAMSGLVALTARIPGAEWHVASPAIPAVALCYLCLLLACRPGAAPALRRGAACVAAALVAWWLWSPRDLPEGTLRVTFLDVGQGDATLLELPDGEAVLVDAGAAYDRLDMGRAVVAPYLWDRGIRRLDLVIGTHPQLDHVGGMAWVVSRFAVGGYRGNGVVRPHPVHRRVREALAATRLEERPAAEGELLLATPSCELLVLHPAGPVGPTVAALEHVSGHELNNRSVVTRLDCGPHAVLLAADIEREAMRRLLADGAPLTAPVVKVPHHGGRSSLHPRWIREVGAEQGVISVGRHNSYRHPAPSILRAYGQAGTTLSRTDEHGAVILTATMSPTSRRLVTARALEPRPVRFGRAPLETEARNVRAIWRRWMGQVPG